MGLRKKIRYGGLKLTKN